MSARRSRRSLPPPRPDRTPARPSGLSSLLRTLRWHRRGLAALCAALAVFTGLSALAPRPAATREVVVASHDLAAGAKLASGDVTVVRYPVGLAPVSAVGHAGDAVSRTLSAAVAAGTPLTQSAFSSSSSLAAPGQQLVPFHLSDPSVLTFVHVGDLVSVVVATSDQQAVTLAERVRVAALPQSSGSGGLIGSSGGNGALVVVSCDPATAARLAASAGSSQLGITVG